MSKIDSLPFMRSNRVKKVFKDICDLYDLVYFGAVSQHNDDHQMVRGFTLSPSHSDKHYCVGTVSGRDIVLLERTDTVSFPDKPSKAYTWVIMQVDLNSKVPTHAVFNSYHYEDAIYSTLFNKLSHLKALEPASISGYDAQFLQRFRTYVGMQHIDSLFRVLTPDVAATLGHHFAMFDFEMIDDTLIVYAPLSSPSVRDIEHLTKASIWFATEIEKNLAT